MRALHAAIAACACLAILAGVATVAAAPPPEQLCGVCASEDSNQATHSPHWPGIEGATGGDALDIAIDETGDSRWTARVPVNTTVAERYRTNESALETAVENGWARSHAASGDVRDVNATISNGTVVVSYTVEDVARPGVGDAWIVDYFYAAGTPTRYELGAERVTLHPPDGASVATHPSAATVEDGSVTWTSDESTPTTSDFDTETLVTYGPAGVSTAVAARASIAAAVGPGVARDAALGGLVPGVAVGGVAVGVALAGGRRKRRVVTSDIRRRMSRLGATLGVDDLADATVALGLAGVAVGLLGVALGTGPTAANAVALGAAAASYAAVVAVVRRLENVRTPTLLAAAAVGALGCGAITWVLTGSPNASVPAAFTLTALAFLPLGHALERGDRGAVAASATLALSGPFLAMAVIAPVYVFGLNPIVYGLFVLPTTLLAAGAGYPLSVVGRRLAEEE